MASIPCNSNYLLKHVVSECVGVADVRQTFYNGLLVPSRCRIGHSRLTHSYLINNDEREQMYTHYIIQEFDITYVLDI
jgi:hypothetical protein